MSLRQRPSRSNSDRTPSLNSEERQEILRSREAARMRAARSKAVARNSRVRGANRNRDKPLIDPHGLYGTRTAQRMRAVRRRQNLQKTLFFVAFFALIAVLISRWETSRVGTLQVSSEQRFGGAILSPVVWRDDEMAWVESSGVVRLLDTRTNKTRRLIQMQFPSSSAPLFLKNSLVLAAVDGTLQALNKRDGKKIWSRKLSFDTQVRLTEVRVLDADEKPQVAIIAAGDNGRIAALKSNTGEVIWSRDLRATIGNGLTVINSTLWIPLGANPKGRGGLTSLDARTGREVKNIDLGAAHIAAVSVGDAPQNKRLVVSAGDDGALFCYDATTFKRLWKTFAQPASDALPNAAIVIRGEPLFKTYRWGQRVFIGANDGYLRAFNARTGREMWKFDAGAAVTSRPVSLRRKVNGEERDFLISTDIQGVLRVLDAQSGALEWQATGDSASHGSFIVGNEIRNVLHDGRVQHFLLSD